MSKEYITNQDLFYKRLFQYIEIAIAMNKPVLLHKIFHDTVANIARPTERLHVYPASHAHFWEMGVIDDGGYASPGMKCSCGATLSEKDVEEIVNAHYWHMKSPRSDDER